MPASTALSTAFTAFALTLGVTGVLGTVRDAVGAASSSWLPPVSPTRYPAATAIAIIPTTAPANLKYFFTVLSFHPWHTHLRPAANHLRTRASTTPLRSVRMGVS